MCWTVLLLTRESRSVTKPFTRTREIALTLLLGISSRFISVNQKERPDHLSEQHSRRSDYGVMNNREKNFNN
jgi:hypothetical protein